MGWFKDQVKRVKKDVKRNIGNVSKGAASITGMDDLEKGLNDFFNAAATWSTGGLYSDRDQRNDFFNLAAQGSTFGLFGVDNSGRFTGGALTEGIKELTGANAMERQMRAAERLAAKEDRRRASMLANEQFMRMQDDLAASRFAGASRRTASAANRRAIETYFGSRLGSGTNDNNFLGL